MRNRLAPEHRIPRYNAFSTPEERAAYIDATASSPAILTYTSDNSPTLSEKSLARDIIIRPLDQDGDADKTTRPSSRPQTRASDSNTRIGRLTAMFTLYNLARTCEEIEANDWDEYITPYEEGDLEMLQRVCPREWWDAEIRAAWPNLVVFARWAKTCPDNK